MGTLSMNEKENKRKLLCLLLDFNSNYLGPHHWSHKRSRDWRHGPTGTVRWRWRFEFNTWSEVKVMWWDRRAGHSTLGRGLVVVVGVGHSTTGSQGRPVLEMCRCRCRCRIFRSFGSNSKFVRVFLSNFEYSTNILCYFLKLNARGSVENSSSRLI